jgi:hypothetical protein
MRNRNKIPVTIRNKYKLALMLFSVGRPGKTQTKNPAFLILYGQTLIILDR